MTRTRFWRLAATLVIGALVGGIPLVTSGPTTEERAAAPGANVCVFYGICYP